MNRIAQLRKEKHLNQIGLAMKLNISQYMVSAYETGRHQPTADMLIMMADFFGVSVDYLIGRSNTRHCADSFSGEGLDEREVELLDLFRTLTKERREQAIGVVFALGQL